MIEPDICNALCDWLHAKMKEAVGPGEDPRASGRDYAYYRADDVFGILADVVPDAITNIKQAYVPGNSWHYTFSRLDDRTVGQLMQAGAAKFLR